MQWSWTWANIKHWYSHEAPKIRRLTLLPSLPPVPNTLTHHTISHSSFNFRISRTIIKYQLFFCVARVLLFVRAVPSHISLLFLKLVLYFPYSIFIWVQHKSNKLFQQQFYHNSCKALALFTNLSFVDPFLIIVNTFQCILVFLRYWYWLWQKTIWTFES